MFPVSLNTYGSLSCPKCMKTFQNWNYRSPVPFESLIERVFLCFWHWVTLCVFNSSMLCILWVLGCTNLWILIKAEICQLAFPRPCRMSINGTSPPVDMTWCITDRSTGSIEEFWSWIARQIRNSFFFKWRLQFAVHQHLWAYPNPLRETAYLFHAWTWWKRYIKDISSI